MKKKKLFISSLSDKCRMTLSVLATPISQRIEFGRVLRCHVALFIAVTQ